MGKLLETIHTPADLKKLTIPELETLAQEIREQIVATVSTTGGHLSGPLGAVELAIALHYVFDAPEDKIIWDVGHQAYAHKIITGRREKFSTLRQHKGISGFPQMGESPYDAFGTGHGGTSISSALGLSEANQHNKNPHKVIAVIGDGSMTAGMAFEALNNAGSLKRNIIIVLNDNTYSISPNVGMVSSFLSRKLTGRFFLSARKEIKSLLRSVPGIGQNLYNLVKRAEDSLKALLIPGILFEIIGSHYVGPVPGHRIDQLIEIFSNVQRWEGPVVIHVYTQKGKGYPPAEKDPVFYHGIGAFDVPSGKPVEREDGIPSYTEAFVKALIPLARNDKRIVAITAAMLEGTGLDKFSKEFPDRCYDVGIAEQHAVTFAAGLAAGGMVPVVAIYSTFLQRAYDQIVHDVCIQNLHVVFALDRGGIVGADGSTHQGVFDLSYLRALPNMVIMSPKDECELGHMLRTAIESKGPVAVRYPRGKGQGVPIEEGLKSLPIGKSEVLRNGSALAILAIGPAVYQALSAAEILAEEGIDAFVVNARFVKPLDKETICRLARETGKLVTVEENALMGGFGSAVLEVLQEAGIKDVVVKRLGVPDEVVHHGPQSLFREKFGIDSKGIANAARKLLKGSGLYS